MSDALQRLFEVLREVLNTTMSVCLSRLDAFGKLGLTWADDNKEIEMILAVVIDTSAMDGMDVAPENSLEIDDCNREPTSLQATSYSSQATSYKPQATSCKLQARLQATGYRLQAAGCRL